MTAKVCIACGESKPLDLFYRHPGMADGHLGRCKECQKSLARQTRLAKLEHVREYDRQRASLGHRRELTKRTVRRERELHPEKSRARSAVQRAIRAGSLARRPCEVCGRADSHAHHDDYGRPLDVRWLCPVHHSEAHQRGQVGDTGRAALVGMEDG